MARTKQDDVTKAGEQTVQVEILHPINHDHKVYSRGLHDLDPELADLFLSFKDPLSQAPIARLPETTEVSKGTVKDDPSKKTTEKNN